MVCDGEVVRNITRPNTIVRLAASGGRPGGDTGPHVALGAVGHAVGVDPGGRVCTVAVAREPGQAGRRSRFALAALRLALIVLVITMMHGWMLQRHRTDLPDLLLVVDDSQSMGFVDQYEDRDWSKRLQARLQKAELDVPSRINVAKSLLLQRGAGWLDHVRDRYNVRLHLLGATARIQSVPARELNAHVPRHAGSAACQLFGGWAAEHSGGSAWSADRRCGGAYRRYHDGREIACGSHRITGARRLIPLFLVGVGDVRPLVTCGSRISWWIERCFWATL